MSKIGHGCHPHCMVCAHEKLFPKNRELTTEEKQLLREANKRWTKSEPTVTLPASLVRELSMVLGLYAEGRMGYDYNTMEAKEMLAKLRPFVPGDKS